MATLNLGMVRIELVMGSNVAQARVRLRAPRRCGSRCYGGVKVNQLVDAVFVLSVRSFTDRIAHIRAEMTRHAIDSSSCSNSTRMLSHPKLLERRFAPSDLKPVTSRWS